MSARLEALAPAPAAPAPLPGWVTSAAPETLEEAGFLAGAALAHLHGLRLDPSVPQALWRARLAMEAAATCATLEGRREGLSALRDALHLTRPGDDPGPAGLIARRWTLAAAAPLSPESLTRALPGVSAAQIARALATGGAPTDRAAKVIEAHLAEHPRAETEALILAEAALARALGWSHLLPVMARALKARDLRAPGEALRLACHRALVAGARQAVPLAAELARAAARLESVAPKLRAKAAGRALALFLARDALAPQALEVMPDRAARRLCDRLVSLGALRELTGRDSFRLYGL